MSDDLARVLANADHCHGIVTRDGEQDACGKPPVAVIDGRGTEDEGYWPACAYHANRYGRGKCVPLARLLADAEAKAEERGRREVREAVTSREWADAFLTEWQRPHFGDNPRDALGYITRAARAALTTGDPA